MLAFYIVNSRVLKDDFQIEQRRTLGAARPQTCARAVTALDPQLAK